MSENTNEQTGECDFQRAPENRTEENIRHEINDHKLPLFPTPSPGDYKIPYRMSTTSNLSKSSDIDLDIPSSLRGVGSYSAHLPVSYWSYSSDSIELPPMESIAEYRYGQRQWGSDDMMSFPPATSNSVVDSCIVETPMEIPGDLTSLEAEQKPSYIPHVLNSKSLARLGSSTHSVRSKSSTASTISVTSRRSRVSTRSKSSATSTESSRSSTFSRRIAPSTVSAISRSSTLSTPSATPSGSVDSGIFMLPEDNPYSFVYSLDHPFDASGVKRQGISEVSLLLDQGDLLDMKELDFCTWPPRVNPRAKEDMSHPRLRSRLPGHFRSLPSTDKDSTTPGPRSSPAPVTDPNSTCLTCGEVGHSIPFFCPNTHTIREHVFPAPYVSEVPRVFPVIDSVDAAYQAEQVDANAGNSRLAGRYPVPRSVDKASQNSRDFPSPKKEPRPLPLPSPKGCSRNTLTTDLLAPRATRSDSGCSISEYETDWEEDEITSSIQDIDLSSSLPDNKASLNNSPGDLISQVLSPMKQALLDRMMAEFWIIFNQETDLFPVDPASALDSTGQNHIRKATASGDCDTRTNTTNTEQYSSFTGSSQLSSNRMSNIPQKRSREGQDGQDESNDGERNPKHPRPLLSPPKSQDDSNKFACPYRKYDPRKYCVRFWRPCALTPLESVARVKAHLYRHHSIFPCHRCKQLFKDQNEVKQHVQNVDPCELRETGQIDGLTSDIVDKLRSRKRSDRNQSEEDRWKEIYNLLFPHEIVPSPYFEAIQENPSQSPDSRGLADYEDYARQELPRVFRASLEEIIRSQSQPLEDSLRSQLVTIIRDSQDRVFSRYRESIASDGFTPSGNPANCSAPAMASTSPAQAMNNSSFNNDTNAEIPTINSVPPYLQPPTPQNDIGSHHQIDASHCVVPPHENKPSSDSGYGSSSSDLPSSSPPSNEVRNSGTANTAFEPHQPRGEMHLDMSLPQTDPAEEDTVLSSTEDFDLMPIAEYPSLEFLNWAELGGGTLYDNDGFDDFNEHN